MEKPETTMRTLTKFTNSQINLQGLLACFLMLGDAFLSATGEESLTTRLFIQWTSVDKSDHDRQQ